MIRIRNMESRKDINQGELVEMVCNRIKIKKENIVNSYIIKRSVDARDKGDIHFVYTVDLELNISEDIKGTEKVEKVVYPEIKKNRNSNVSPIIVGAGPAGLFAAITLIESRNKASYNRARQNR